MPKKPKYFLERDGRFFARIVVPKKLRPFLENRVELRTALGGDKQKAMRAFHGAVGMLQHQIVEAENKLADATTSTSLSKRKRYSIQEIAVANYLSGIAFDEELRATFPSYARIELSREDAIDFIDGMSGKLTNEQLKDTVGLSLICMRNQGYHDFEYNTPEWRELAMALCRSDYEVLKRRSERSEGDFNGTPVDPLIRQGLDAWNENAANLTNPSISLQDVISREVQRRSLGKDAKPLPPKSESKYRLVATEFHDFRKSADILTVSVEEVRKWMESLQTSGKYSNTTVAQKIQNLRTVFNWGRDNFPDIVFPLGNPVDSLKLPEARRTSSQLKTFKLAEAARVLKHARLEANPIYRYVPFVCAYTGMRIAEVGALRKEDFVKYQDRWIISVTTLGGRTLKNDSSERRIPVHRSLEAEGFIEFVKNAPDGQLFRGSTKVDVNIQPFMNKWLRNIFPKSSHPDLKPNHGWRHLFEDLCRRDQVPEEARAYITGRSFANSQSLYGRSEVMLPGLIAAIDRIKPFDV